MDFNKLLHELILGALAGNIVIAFGFLKFLYRLYQQYEAFVHRHNLMYEDYCKRKGIRPKPEKFMTEPSKIPFLNKPTVPLDQSQIKAGADARLQDYNALVHPKLDPKHTGINAMGHRVNTKPAPGIANTPGPHNIVEDNDAALAHKGTLAKLHMVSKYVTHGVAEAVEAPIHVTEKLEQVGKYKVASTSASDEMPATNTKPVVESRMVPKVATDASKTTN